MAIGYARIEFVKRSIGKTACAKAAYNSRTLIEFEGNKTLDPEKYDWSSKEHPAHHEILLPNNAHEKFKAPKILWNAVEASETRINSVVAMELLLALPDDNVIAVEDRIQLAKTFVQMHFINKGLAAQIDIHSPERKIQITRNNSELGLFKGMTGNLLKQEENIFTIQLDNSQIVSFNSHEFSGFIEKENNWHAHVLITTRRFKENGLELDDHKARDLMPRISNGKVTSGPDWGKLWTDHQNQYFEAKGLDLRVDAPGIIPQEHLGPYRMRGRAFALLEEHGRLIEANAEEVKNPTKVLEAITKRQSIFTKEDVEHFLSKHVAFESQEEFRELFWSQKDIIPLVDKETGELLGKFSTQRVIEEEKMILRLADKMHAKPSLEVKTGKISSFSSSLTAEQNKAFKEILEGKKLSFLQGYAGTGKSFLLKALKDAYEASGYYVRAFGPDSATADILKEKGFQTTENIYRFLFGIRNGKRDIHQGKEVWFLDESGKLGNTPLLEFLKEANKRNVQVIFSGDHAQMPSVERGGMFKFFCERYGSHELTEIQRQKKQQHREIARNLATGELGIAIDRLSANSSIQWSTTKKESVEELISKWAMDTQAAPHISTLIIAHSNDEVRLLNEMVRIIKKQRGELSEKEFSCETSFGKVYLSVGDHIEFRKNNREIGVTNGLSGKLVEAQKDKFVVSIKEGAKKRRTVVFNPQEYHAYQLGYASTYFRSQGKTIDKAYIMHNPALNKPMFYVGLTRHVQEAYYFVSKEQVYCLADLKRQAIRENLKETTSDYLNMYDLQKQHQILEKQQEIQQLKESDSFLDKIKGYGLSAYNITKTKVHSVREHFQDKTPNEEFFNPKIREVDHSARIEELPLEKLEPDHILKTVLVQENKAAQRKNDPVIQANSVQDQENKISESLIKKCKKSNNALWRAFGTEKQEMLEAHFSLASRAASLYAIVDLEAKSTSRSLEASMYFKEWQESCGKRNASAYNLMQSVPANELNAFLGKKTARVVLEQGVRHQCIIERQEASKSFNVENELKGHIEPLLYRLFPDGPARRHRTTLRFGNKGSLSVELSGNKAGSYYDFERGEGGGLLSLVQQQLGLGRSEAHEWAKEFLGIVQDIQVPKAFTRASNAVHQDSEWMSLKPNNQIPAPKLEEIPGKKLHHVFNEVARHAYHDEDGNTLYYVLRLIDKNDPSKKITPPLSFGHGKSYPEKTYWDLKGFQSEKSILYNAHLLKQNPYATVLVVEGEKTADQALNKFPSENLICITWSGGSGAVKRADWSPLIGRNVIVWPDNDDPGRQAGIDVCKELKMVGVQSLRMVDSKALATHFPKKWDLADNLPNGANDTVLKKLLEDAPHLGIDPYRVLFRVSAFYKNTSLEYNRVNEILWRVDERLRRELEKTMRSNSRKIEDAILAETTRILLQGKGRATPDVQHGDRYHLSWQVLIYEAEHGKAPISREIDRMRTIAEKLDLHKVSNIKNDAYFELSANKLLSREIQKNQSGQEVKATKLHQEISPMAQHFKTQCERLQIQGSGSPDLQRGIRQDIEPNIGK